MPNVGDVCHARDLPAGAIAQAGTSTTEYVKCSNIDSLMRWEQPIPGSGEWLVRYVGQLPGGERMTDTEKREVEAARVKHLI
jgi:hypothetical protein